MKFDDVEYLKRIIQHQPNWFLDELQFLLLTDRFISVQFTTIPPEFERAGLPTKKPKKIAAGRNEHFRADFIRRVAEYSPEQLELIGVGGHAPRRTQETLEGTSSSELGSALLLLFLSVC